MELPKNLILKSIAGSHLYGLNTPSSDIDIRGIYFEDINDVLNIGGRQNTEIADNDQDEKYYSLGKFLKLAAECNPNIIELLWVPDDAIQYKSPLYDELVSHRDWFMSKRARHTFTGYAYAQIQRARGLNKKGNDVPNRVNEKGIENARMLLSQPFSGKTRIPDNQLNERELETAFGKNFVAYLKKKNVEWIDGMDPILLKLSPELQSMLPPSPKHFIHWLRYDEHGFPFRPVKFTESIMKYDAASVENVPRLYRLYHNGTGFVSSDNTQVVCHSISKKREVSDFAGIVTINFNDYEKAKKEYDSFWEWMVNRNEARYTNDFDENTLTDNKNLMHTMRLMLCAKSIALTGVPKIRFEGEEKQYLMDIRNGKHSYENILKRAEEMMNEINELFDKSNLPHSANVAKINDWYMEKIKEQVK